MPERVSDVFADDDGGTSIDCADNSEAEDVPVACADASELDVAKRRRRAYGSA